jgi:hypothetical protein
MSVPDFETWLSGQREQVMHLFKDPAAADVAYLNGRLQMLKEVEVAWERAHQQETVTVEVGPSHAVVYSTIPPGGGSGLGPDAYNSAGDQSRKATTEEVMAAFVDVVARQGPVFDKLAAIEAAEKGPQKPAEGRGGHWVRLGEVCVDGCSVMVVDPCYADRYDRPPGGARNNELFHDFGPGIEFMPGFGDGGYVVWAWVVEYTTYGEPDERIAAISMTFIDQKDLDQWQAS